MFAGWKIKDIFNVSMRIVLAIAFDYKRHILLICVWWKANDDNHCILDICVTNKIRMSQMSVSNL